MSVYVGNRSLVKYVLKARLMDCELPLAYRLDKRVMLKK